MTLEHPHPLLLAINTYILQWMSKTKKLIRRNLCLPLSIRNIQISCEKRFSFQNYSLKNKPFYYIHISLTILGNVNGVVTQLRNTILEIYFQFGVKYSLKNKVYPFKKNHCDYFRNSRTICSEYEWRCLVYRHYWFRNFRFIPGTISFSKMAFILQNKIPIFYFFTVASISLKMIGIFCVH